MGNFSSIPVDPYFGILTVPSHWNRTYSGPDPDMFTDIPYGWPVPGTNLAVGSSPAASNLWNIPPYRGVMGGKRQSFYVENAMPNQSTQYASTVNYPRTTYVLDAPQMPTYGVLENAELDTNVQ